MLGLHSSLPIRLIQLTVAPVYYADPRYGRGRDHEQLDLLELMPG